ncbi:hypothetical protein FHG87_022151 [Trinorchestia longiramus]|nr:hypothetical protein FHG87_022151 [Trinorchestia longiramus]
MKRDPCDAPPVLPEPAGGADHRPHHRPPHPLQEVFISGRGRFWTTGSSSRLSRAPLPTLPQSDSSKPCTSSPAPNLSLQSRRALPVPKSFPPFVPPIHPPIPNITPKTKEQQTHNTYAEIAKHAIQQTNPTQHALTLINQTHLKLTALILEAHIAALDKTQKFGDILSKSLKTNFDIDTTFPDRDSAAIFNFYYDKTGTQQLHTKQTLSQETQKSHETI